MKVAVFGLPGTGKTTLAQYMAARTNSAVTSLDDILFAPGGPLPLDGFRTAAARVTDGPQWIVEGNYSKLAEVVWHRADILVWLDYPLPVITWRIARRWLRQLTGREANPNRLTFRSTFTARRSVLRNASRKYRGNRSRYTAQAEEAAALGVEVLRFHRPGQARDWLQDATLTTGPRLRPPRRRRTVRMHRGGPT
ncbi:adenylate kinase [Streptomyces sp. NPDC056707]|uniref:adenylate kinase n=1 Tax=Streptomyces sp. NPDC056707 TaxID=3345919 RepID=UPI00367989B6